MEYVFVKEMSYHNLKIFVGLSFKKNSIKLEYTDESPPPT